eukprot:TRINITY_DN57715_c0_g1_i1.p1 TRINITY_DN57715_c0_g1~~TRINITY_DN57715_c0_g1_i1.p1  ORF type:complete len:137 (+),score=23.43 TRINITY_DN57715_c0_g1_i1:57-413(+)
MAVQLPKISAAEVQQHRSKDSFWVVADGHVVDVTDFIEQHPGGIEKIMSAGNDFSFRSHFGATYDAFQEACKLFRASGQPMEFTFANSRKNGGLNSSGRITGKANGPVGSVNILGIIV